MIWEHKIDSWTLNNSKRISEWYKSILERALTDTPKLKSSLPLSISTHSNYSLTYPLQLLTHLSSPHLASKHKKSKLRSRRARHNNEVTEVIVVVIGGRHCLLGLSLLLRWSLLHGRLLWGTLLRLLTHCWRWYTGRLGECRPNRWLEERHMW
jgi:hypothetical protein